MTELFARRYRLRMRTPPLVVALLMAASTLTVPGCVPQSRPVIPTAVPTSTPVFATDADALAAAKTAFGGYVAASDAIGQDGGYRPDRIAIWVAPDQYKTELAIFNKFRESGDHMVGGSRLYKFSVQQVGRTTAARTSVMIYVCDDVSQTRLINALGQDITPASRPNVFPFQVDLVNESKDSTKLLVEESGPWSGANFC